MIHYRCFRNDDPPGLVQIWNESFTGRGAVRMGHSSPFEYHVFAKPYFDPAGFILAFDDQMLVGYAHSAAMHQMSPGQTGGQSFAGLSAAVGHDCCKARNSSSKRSAGTANRRRWRSEFSTGLKEIALPTNSAPSGAMSCCPLTSGSFVVASHTRANEANESVLAHGNDLPLSLAKSNAAPLATPLRLPSQNQTYLRCCVFLI